MDKKIDLLSVVTEIYIAIMIIFFPLCVDSTGFFRILECKYKYFIIINLVYICSILLIILFELIFSKNNVLKKIKFTKVHLALLLFLIINIISTHISPFLKYCNLYVGVGRLEGLITHTLYCLIFFNITLFGKFTKRFVWYFNISSCLFSIICILQYIGFNPFNMYQDGIGTHNVSFIGTIGNLDTVSAIYCIYLTLSIATYVFINDIKRNEKIICLISIFTGFFIFEVLDILSGMVAFVLTLLIFLPHILTNSKRLSRILVVGGMILLGYATNLIINPVYHYSICKLKLDFQLPIYAIVLLVISCVFILLSRVLNNTDFDYSKNKNVIKKIYVTIIFSICFSLLMIYFIDFPLGMLSEIHEIFHGNFDDEFGTYRIFLWKRSFLILKDYPLLGTGADTFAIRFMDRFKEDVEKLGELTINDTASNSYITMAVNIGIIGLLSYLIFIILNIKNYLKNKNEISIVFFSAFICFLIQDFFNLWVVIVTPIFWILISMLYLSLKKEKEIRG